MTRGLKTQPKMHEYSALPPATRLREPLPLPPSAGSLRSQIALYPRPTTEAMRSAMRIAVHGRAHDTTRVARPFARGVEPGELRRLERLGISRDAHGGARSRFDPDEDGLVGDVTRELSAERAERRPEDAPRTECPRNRGRPRRSTPSSRGRSSSEAPSSTRARRGNPGHASRVRAAFLRPLEGARLDATLQLDAAEWTVKSGFLEIPWFDFRRRGPSSRRANSLREAHAVHDEAGRFRRRGHDEAPGHMQNENTPRSSTVSASR